MKGKHQYSGFPDDCSPEQLETLAKFRQEVRNMGCSDPPYDDPYLLRFLRARKFDLTKTLVMWNNFIKWRKENNIDDIMNMKFPEIEEAKKYYPHGYYKTDKLGRPIYIERIGYLKFEQLVKTIPLEKLQLYFIQSYERLIHEIFPACSKAAGKRVEQTCYVIDLKGAALKVFPKLKDIIKLASSIGQDYYPEILGTMFIINAPMLFSGIWSIIKHFIDEKTKKKILILDSKYQKELHQYVDLENLPDFLGGKLTIADYGDPFCKEKGPWTEHEDIKTLNVLLKPNAVEYPLETSEEKKDETHKPQEQIIKVEKEVRIERKNSLTHTKEVIVEKEVYVIKQKNHEQDVYSFGDLPEVAEEKSFRHTHAIHDFNILLCFDNHKISTKRS